MKKIKLILTYLLLTPFLFACAKEIKDVNLSDIYEEFEEMNQLPDMVTADNQMLEDYYGINEEDCNQYVVKISIEATITDEIVMIEGKDDEASNRIEEKLEKRRKYKEDEADGYLPDQYAVIKEATVERIDNYICLIISPQASEYAEIYNSYFK